MHKKVKKIKYAIKNDEFWGAFAKNSTWAFVGDSLASVMGLVITIIMIKILGSDGYGIFVLAQTYMIIMDIIINVQSWKGVIQYGQACIAQKDLAKLGSYVRTGAILDLSTAVLCGVIAILLAPMLGGVLHWSDELIRCAQIFSIVAFSHFAGTPTAVLRLADRFDLVAGQKFLSALIKLLAFVVIWIMGTAISLEGATIIYVVAEILGNILLVGMAVVVYKKKFGLKNVFKKQKNKKTGEFLRYNLWGTLIEIFDLPVNYLDMFIVAMIGVDYVAVYKVFKQVVNVFQKITSSIQQAIMPQLSDLYARGKKKRGYEVILKIRNVTLAVGIPIALALGVTSPLWLNWFYGEFYAQEWGSLLAFLLVQMLALSYAALHPYFLSLGKPKQAAFITLITNLVYLAIAYFLVLKIGLMAMVFAFLVQSAMNILLKVGLIKKGFRYEKES